jgi:hypothetical protein
MTNFICDVRSFGSLSSWLKANGIQDVWGFWAKTGYPVHLVYKEEPHDAAKRWLSIGSRRISLSWSVGHIGSFIREDSVVLPWNAEGMADARKHSGVSVLDPGTPAWECDGRLHCWGLPDAWKEFPSWGITPGGVAGAPVSMVVPKKSGLLSRVLRVFR